MRTIVTGVATAVALSLLLCAPGRAASKRPVVKPKKFVAAVQLAIGVKLEAKLRKRLVKAARRGSSNASAASFQRRAEVRKRLKQLRPVAREMVRLKALQSLRARIDREPDQEPWKTTRVVMDAVERRPDRRKATVEQGIPPSLRGYWSTRNARGDGQSLLLGADGRYARSRVSTSGRITTATHERGGFRIVGNRIVMSPRERVGYRQAAGSARKPLAVKRKLVPKKHAWQLRLHADGATFLVLDGRVELRRGPIPAALK